MTSRPARRATRAITALAGFTVAALAFAGCASGSGSSPSSAPSDGDSAGYGDLSVQLSWIKNEEFSGEFFADSEGYYTEAGFDSVTLTPVRPPVPPSSSPEAPTSPCPTPSRSARSWPLRVPR